MSGCTLSLALGRPANARGTSWRSLFAAAMAIAATLVLAGAAFAADVPYLTGRVVDNAELLGAATRSRIESTLKAHEDSTGDQIVVLTTRSLAGESIEQYAQNVFAEWKLGQKGKDNGILVIVAPAEHKLRIEVGYGLEGPLPDVIAARIIRDIMTPAFKRDDFDGGIDKGVEAIVAQLEGRGDALGLSSSVADEPHGIKDFSTPANDMSWPMRVLLGCFIFGIIGMFTVLGVLTPGVGWFLYLFLIPFWAMFPMVIVEPQFAVYILGAYVIGFPIAKLIVRGQPWYAKAAKELKKSGTTRVGGMVITSGGSSGGSSAGGGYSGGGGSSGGGGASGSW